MRRYSLLLIISILLGCATGDYDYELEVTETRTWPADGISQITVTTKNGDIVVSAMRGDSIIAEITRRCMGEDKTDAEAHIDNVVVTDTVIADQLTLEAEMPDNDSGRDYLARFDISTPESIYVDLTTINGNLLLNDMVAGAKLATTNGNILGQNLRGSINGQSINGNIIYDMVELDATESVVLSTTNGEVTLELPSDVSATFDASTTNGTVTITGFASVNYTINEPTHKAGTIGSGGATITISSTNGNVTIQAR